MTAALVLPGTATEADWLAARREGVTASEIAVLMGLSPYSSPYALYWQKRGDLPGQDDNLSMAIGRHFEDFVAGAFQERRAEFCVNGDGRALYAHPARPWQIATPDRHLHEADAALGCSARMTCRARDPLAVLECKTDGGYDGWGEDGTDEIPVHYRCQILWQMDVVGVTTGYVACLFLHSRKLRVYELTLDAQARADLALMRIEAELFLCRLQDSRPPDVDWRPATSLALKRLHPSLEDTQVVVPKRMWQAWRAAAGRVTSAEHAKRRLENQIRERLGSASTAVLRDGTKIATRVVYDRKGYEVKPTTIDQLRPSKIKEN